MNVLRLFISRRTMLPKVANSDGKICQGVPAGLLFALAVLFTSSPSVPYGALVGRMRGSFPRFATSFQGTCTPMLQPES